MTFRPITACEAARIAELRANGVSQFAIAADVDRPQSVVSRVLSNLSRDQHHYAAVDEMPVIRKDLNLEHVRRVTAGGYGYPVVTQPLLSRLYALEYAPAAQMARYGAAA